MNAGRCGDQPKTGPEPGTACAHCGRRCGTLAGGFARIAGEPVCSHPVEPNRPDCYRMVMVKFHKLHHCPDCMVRDLPTYPQPARRTGQRLDLC